MKAWVLLAKLLALVLVSLLLLWAQGALSLFWFDLLVVVLALVKTLYFVQLNYRQILAVSLHGVLYHRFMIYLVANICLMILSYGLDYYLIYQADKSNFVGIAPDQGAWRDVFDCLYLSVLNFTFFGYGEIMPRQIPGKLLVMMEAMVSFLIIIFILSDFFSLKESIREGVRQGVEEEKKKGTS